jgi:hypothetical protein
MIEVYLLTPEQAESLIGIEFLPYSFFNPIKDSEGNWIITIEEVNNCSIKWVKELPKIEFNPYISAPGEF